ncbi:hypothetical protein LTR29_018217, partial [Friedmanniomyces endolithicus]
FRGLPNLLQRRRMVKSGAEHGSRPNPACMDAHRSGRHRTHGGRDQARIRRHPEGHDSQLLHKWHHGLRDAHHLLLLPHRPYRRIRFGHRVPVHPSLRDRYWIRSGSGGYNVSPSCSDRFQRHELHGSLFAAGICLRERPRSSVSYLDCQGRPKKQLPDPSSGCNVRLLHPNLPHQPRQRRRLQRHHISAAPSPGLHLHDVDRLPAMAKVLRQASPSRQLDPRPCRDADERFCARLLRVPDHLHCISRLGAGDGRDAQLGPCHVCGSSGAGAGVLRALCAQDIRWSGGVRRICVL